MGAPFSMPIITSYRTEPAPYVAPPPPPPPPPPPAGTVVPSPPTDMRVTGSQVGQAILTFVLPLYRANGDSITGASVTNTRVMCFNSPEQALLGNQGAVLAYVDAGVATQVTFGGLSAGTYWFAGECTSDDVAYSWPSNPFSVTVT